MFLGITRHQWVHVIAWSIPCGLAGTWWFGLVALVIWYLVAFSGRWLP